LFAFEPLAEDDVVVLLRRAVDDADRGLGSLGLAVDDDAIRFLARTSDGDARRALTALEVAAKSLPEGDRRLSLDVARDSVQRKVMNFDPTGDTHYDLASALIKSMRGSDPDAAVYWLARMLESGEDPRFIARRIVICASEDVGNADPQALGVATAMLQAVEFVGLPECGLALAQAAVYIACAPKSNAVTMALADARAEIRDGRTLAVPKHLRDAHYPGAAQLGHGTDYQYSHDFPGGWVDQAYLPESRLYYVPTDRGFEAVIRERLDELRKRRSGRKPYCDPDGSDRS
jgi:putative ATPase